MGTTGADRVAERHETARAAVVGRGGRPTGLAGSLLLLAAGLLLNTVLGPLVLDAIDYPLSQTIENQLVGLELVTVYVVAPVCVAAAVLAARGHPAGAPLAIGPAAYTAYMFAQYVVGPGYDAYTPGVLLHLALFVLGLVLAVWRGSRLAAAALHAVVGWFALVPPSVASMGAVMLARDDPYAAGGQVVVLSAVAVVFAVFAVVVFRPLFAPRQGLGEG